MKSCMRGILASIERMSFLASVVGRFAEQAAAGGEGEVRAVFRRSFYLCFPGNRYACVGDTSLGCGPLNALISDFRLPALGERMALDTAGAQRWMPAPLSPGAEPNLRALHACLEALFSTNAEWPQVLGRLDNLGHCSGWDSLAGVAAVARLS